MKELIITNFTGEVEHLLLEEKKTFKADKEEFIVIDLSKDHIILSSLNYNNVILRDDIQTKLGRISLEPLSENSNKSKINVKIYEVSKNVKEISLEQAMADLTIEKHLHGKAEGLKDHDVDTNLFKKVFGC